MKRRVLIAIVAVTLGLFGVAAAFAASSDKPPSPPGQGECEHGNSGKPCRDDPQPDHGAECEEHGQKGGVNEDHCKGEQPPVDPPETTTTTTTTEEPPVTTTTVETTTVTTTTEEPPVESTPPTETPDVEPPAEPQEKPEVKPSPTKIVKVEKKANAVVVITTADGKTHTAIQGQG